VGEGPAVFRSEFGERLRSVLDEFGTRAAAAVVADVTPEHLASYIAGRAKPPFELIARVAAARNVSLDWLATGTGPRNLEAETPDGYVEVPFAPDPEMRFSDSETVPVLFARVWLEPMGSAEAMRLIVHRGNANEPVIRDGELLLVDTSVTAVAGDGLYAFARDGKFLARFVETFVNGRVALKARNPDYGAQNLTPDEAGALKPFGRVCWRAGTI
jgi:hypothetical protein